MGSPTLEAPSLDVLIIDDNRDAANSLVSLLELWGQAARVAYGGPEGLQAAMEMPPDCIFLDINMPVLDGYGVAQKIRQRPAMKKVKLIALTAYSDDEHIKKIWEVGFDYYLNKVCSVADIRRVLEMYGKTKSH